MPSRWVASVAAMALMFLLATPAMAASLSPKGLTPYSASPVSVGSPSTGSLTLVAQLTGTAEVPPVATAASGQAVVIVAADRASLTYRITYQGLSSPLRLAAFCIGWSTTDMVCPFIGAELPLGPSPLVGTRAVVGVQAQNWESGQAWIQLATIDHPQGEIRGLLVEGPPSTATALEATSGAAETWPLIVLLALLAMLATFRRLDPRRS